MTIELTVEVPESRRIFLDLPQELPVGRARFEFTVTPETTSQKKNVPSLASLIGVDKDRDTMEAYFERKRANKAQEDAQIEAQLTRNRKAL
jgi:hypothetical protein